MAALMTALMAALMTTLMAIDCLSANRSNDATLMAIDCPPIRSSCPPERGFARTRALWTASAPTAGRAPNSMHARRARTAPTVAPADSRR